MTVSDYIAIPNDWRNVTASQAQQPQLQTAWSGFSNRHSHNTYRQKETIYWNLGLSADASSSKKTVAFTELAGRVT